MVKTDQIAAFHWEKEWDKYKDSVFTKHKIQVEKMFNKYGFLGFDKVGKDGSNDFWLIVQHCDKFPDFQKKILKSMDKEVKKGNANANNYAYLYDRVEANAGRKQLFGTQVDFEVNTTGRAFPKFGLVDSVNVDKIRKEYNLANCKARQWFGLDKHCSTLVLTSSKYFQSAAVRADGILFPNLHKALFVR
eukprot:gene26420-47734_t